MSTGLTWVSFGNYSGNVAESVIVFNDYSEAYSYGEWLVRVTNLYGGTVIRVYIYTSTPNNNGFWYESGGATAFLVYD